MPIVSVGMFTTDTATKLTTQSASATNTTGLKTVTSERTHVTILTGSKTPSRSQPRTKFKFWKMNTDITLNPTLLFIFILDDQFTFFLSEFDCDKLVSFIEKRKKLVFAWQKNSKINPLYIELQLQHTWNKRTCLYTDTKRRSLRATGYNWGQRD